MTRKYVVAVAIGSVVVFLVSSIWHVVSGLGEVGVQQLPNEDRVLSTMRASIHSPGLYLFPGMDTEATGENRHDKQAAYLGKYRTGPTGLLVYHPGGEALAFGRLLVVQFMTGVAGALLLALVLAQTADRSTFTEQVSTVVAIVTFAAVIYEIPNWNWYGFPANYLLAHAAGWIVSWSAAGLAMAAIIRPKTPRLAQ